MNSKQNITVLFLSAFAIAAGAQSAYPGLVR